MDNPEGAVPFETHHGLDPGSDGSTVWIETVERRVYGIVCWKSSDLFLEMSHPWNNFQRLGKGIVLDSECEVGSREEGSGESCREWTRWI